MDMRRTRKQATMTGATDRVRFNRGYHDGASEQERETMKIKYTDGRECAVENEREAREVLSSEYPEYVTCEHGWEPYGYPGQDGERLLAWATEADSIEDGGQNAVASITRVED